VLSVLGEAPVDSDMSEWSKQTWRLNDEQRDLAKRRLALLSVWQMTFPGVPSVYYGDEAGVEGFGDPYNRAPFPWGREDRDILDHYRVIGNLRAEYELFRNGEFISYGGYEHIYAYVRHNERERAVVLLNGSRDAGEEVTLAVSRGETVFVELLSSKALEPEIQTPSSDEASEVAAHDERLFWASGDLDRPDGRENSVLRINVPPLNARVIYIRKAYTASLAMTSLPRAAGILCHITSLPSDAGCGDFGKTAYDFCDYLASAGQSIWQLLPITAAGEGNSPYSGASAFAGNELLICIGDLIKDGLLTERDISKPNLTARVLHSIVTGGDGNRADLARARAFKAPLFKKAFSLFDRDDAAFKAFCSENAEWLPDYCLYRAISDERGGEPWQEWPEALRDRNPEELARRRVEFSHTMEFHAFLQYIFMKQWDALKLYAAKKGVSILGDLPIYVSAAGCDTWVNRALFDMDEHGRMRKTGGVPPDAFTEDGQNWNNPVFDWDANRRRNYSWWIERFRRNLRLYDFLRLDHFRGFEACWEIPAGDETARNGEWRKGPGKELFEAAETALGALPILAEDLGVITPNVNDLRNTFAWPGMKVYQFHADEMLAAVGCEAAVTVPGAESGKRLRSKDLQVFYTGTHDNDTLASFVSENMNTARRAESALGEAGRPDSSTDASSKHVKSACKKIIEDLYATSVMWVILPLQDVWFLGAEARMNTPGVADGNWTLVAPKEAFTRESASWLRGLAESCDRLG
jgi:4-alpha-glucanotransferase